MGYRPILRQQHPVAAAVRIALAGGVLSLALPALPAAAQAAAAAQTAAGSAATTAATRGAAAQATAGNARAQSRANGKLLLAQTVSPPTSGTEETNPGAPAPVLQEVVVTGFRESLAKATAAKRDNIGFTDSIYSEDIGKFADNNIVESFNRVPGITISRDITGQGVNIAIRGLGPDFTKVLLNGAPISVAST